VCLGVSALEFRELGYLPITPCRLVLEPDITGAPPLRGPLDFLATDLVNRLVDELNDVKLIEGDCGPGQMPSCWKVACAGKRGGEGFNLSYEVLAYARPSATPRRYRAGHFLLAGANTPVPERPRFPAAPLSCHVFAARQRATYRGVGSLLKRPWASKIRASRPVYRTPCGACVSSLSRCLALRRSDPRRPMESKSSVARLTAPAGIHRGQAAPTGNYRARAAGKHIGKLGYDPGFSPFAGVEHTLGVEVVK